MTTVYIRLDTKNRGQDGAMATGCSALFILYLMLTISDQNPSSEMLPGWLFDSQQRKKEEKRCQTSHCSYQRS